MGVMRTTEAPRAGFLVPTHNLQFGISTVSKGREGNGEYGS